VRCGPCGDEHRTICATVSEGFSHVWLRCCVVPGVETGAGAAAVQPCGSDSMYCPAGSTAPIAVAVGYYSVGPATLKTSAAVCPLGQYCNGSGSALDCPLGTFGGVQGLSTASCSGRCDDGALCLPRSTIAQGVPCPQGFVCQQGAATPCPTGTYNPGTGAVAASIACIPCPAGTYNARNGSGSLASCTPCPPFEGSTPGSTACWPGLRGTHTCAGVAAGHGILLWYRPHTSHIPSPVLT
jgi:hypothetical protein